MVVGGVRGSYRKIRKNILGKEIINLKFWELVVFVWGIERRVV